MQKKYAVTNSILFFMFSQMGYSQSMLFTMIWSDGLTLMEP
jgi:hypothetical protein